MHVRAYGNAVLAQIDSFADYNWGKILWDQPGGKDLPFPVVQYDEVRRRALDAYDGQRSAALAQGGRPYVVPLSCGWDSTPRTIPSDPYEASNGYPWTAAWANATVDGWREALEQTRAWKERSCANRSALPLGWCPPVLINAWNEWSEGAYLEPDARYGYDKLKALLVATEEDIVEMTADPDVKMKKPHRRLFAAEWKELLASRS